VLSAKPYRCDKRYKKNVRSKPSQARTVIEPSFVNSNVSIKENVFCFMKNFSLNKRKIKQHAKFVKNRQD